ncbi:MAG: DNA polymerase III subunit delta' [Hyphomicrobiales bacterium]|nr:MAG: DNA polymerase III subunit delta' [Hyphomicrobiales bacterium]
MTDAVPGEADALDDIVLPRAQTELIGQREAEEDLLQSYKSGRIHHGWILSGPRGIGKATLAFRFARFVLVHPDPKAPEVQNAHDLSIPEDHPVARKVAVCSHADLYHLRRPWNPKNKRFMTELPVDEVRRATSLFETTAGEGGWRICIVDAADDMNQNAANALLKILEEPPPRALFLVLSHMPGRLLPTIRSRCRKLVLRSLGEADIREQAAATPVGAAAKGDAVSRAAALARGSLRRALVLLASNGVEIWSGLEAVTRHFPALDRRAVHALADRVSERGAEESYALFVDFVRDWLSEQVRNGAASGVAAGGLYGWSEAWEKVERVARETDVFNLDRKQAVFDILHTLAEAARNSLSPQQT